MSLLELFCEIDDFSQEVESNQHQQQLTDENKKRHRSDKMSMNEMMTIMVYFHQVGYTHPA